MTTKNNTNKWLREKGNGINSIRIIKQNHKGIEIN